MVCGLGLRPFIGVWRSRPRRTIGPRFLIPPLGRGGASRDGESEKPLDPSPCARRQSGFSTGTVPSLLFSPLLSGDVALVASSVWQPAACSCRASVCRQVFIVTSFVHFVVIIRGVAGAWAKMRGCNFYWGIKRVEQIFLWNLDGNLYGDNVGNLKKILYLSRCCPPLVLQEEAAALASCTSKPPSVLKGHRAQWARRQIPGLRRLRRNPDHKTAWSIGSVGRWVGGWGGVGLRRVQRTLPPPSSDKTCFPFWQFQRFAAAPLDSFDKQPLFLCVLQTWPHWPWGLGWAGGGGRVRWSCDTVQNVTATSASQRPESWRRTPGQHVRPLWWSINNAGAESSVVNLRRAEEEEGRGLRSVQTQVVVVVVGGCRRGGLLGRSRPRPLSSRLRFGPGLAGALMSHAASLYIKTRSHGSFTPPRSRTTSSWWTTSKSGRHPLLLRGRYRMLAKNKMAGRLDARQVPLHYVKAVTLWVGDYRA